MACRGSRLGRAGGRLQEGRLRVTQLGALRAQAPGPSGTDFGRGPPGRGRRAGPSRARGMPGARLTDPLPSREEGPAKAQPGEGEHSAPYQLRAAGHSTRPEGCRHLLSRGAPGTQPGAQRAPRGSWRGSPRPPQPAGATFPFQFFWSMVTLPSAFAAVRRVRQRCWRGLRPAEIRATRGSPPPEVEARTQDWTNPTGSVAPPLKQSAALLCATAQAWRPATAATAWKYARLTRLARLCAIRACAGGGRRSVRDLLLVKTTRAFAPGLAVRGCAPPPQISPETGDWPCRWGFVKSLATPTLPAARGN